MFFCEQLENTILMEPFLSFIFIKTLNIQAINPFGKKYLILSFDNCSDSKRSDIFQRLNSLRKGNFKPIPLQ